MAKQADILVENHGSIFIIRAVTEHGLAWIENHVDNGGYQPFGRGARLVEHRYIADIVQGALLDGLEVR